MENTQYNRDDQGLRASSEGPVTGAPAAAPMADEMPLRGSERHRSGRHNLPFKSPTKAGWLSLVPGLGQAYVGYYQRGFINIGIVAALITGIVVVEGALDVPFSIFLAFYWLYNMVDASRCASLYNQALIGLRGAELPDDFHMPGGGGSFLGGITLIVFGVLVLLHTKFDLSMAWLEDWWPLLAIGFGVYLVYQNRKGKTE